MRICIGLSLLKRTNFFFRVNPQLNTNFLRLMDILLRGNEANRKFIEASDGISLLLPPPEGLNGVYDSRCPSRGS